MIQNIFSAVSIAAVVGLVSSSFSVNKPANHPAKQKAEWVKLFDGKSTAGWHTYGKENAGSAWKVQDGIIYLDGSSKEGRGDLVTNKEYSNFDFKYEWKISEKGNSGLIFYVHEDPAKFHSTYSSGPEMQVVDNEGHPDGKIFKHQAADLYDLVPCSKKTVKPVGEWNKAEIISNNGKLEFFLNGTKVVSTTMWDASWEKLVAGSKFKDMPGFGTFKSGKFALQDHGDTVWFRNIMIKEL
ncbi:DUF1080 domain-containing protein [Pedobacter sp. HMF7647]|uniref:DUF1080 domain-containing protein n=1 Tax=Hufsiella arboris TaxID=2695275 RepID=A0A7K1Y4Z5_9SPHI|nr:DUF1080 domain-containing protein [Hufsiella arboris]MXV49441.1 DUF1080 domain-containing protein [Hufsiella arboris]